MPNIAYGSNKKTKHLLPSSFWKFLVHNVKDLEELLLCNGYYCADFAQCFLQEMEIITSKTAQLVINITKPNTRLCSKEDEW